MKYLGIIVISLFFLISCNTHDSDNSQNNRDSQENNNLGESSQPLKKISNIIYTDYIDGASTRVAMVTNGFEVPCEGQTNKECGGACGRKTYADSDNNNFICCPSGETDRYKARDYCTEMPTGSICATDAMCADGHCNGTSLGLGSGICGAKDLPNGATCTSNSQCKNDACGRKTASDDNYDNLICCPSNDTYTNIKGNDYCTDLSNGSSCWGDKMCSSNYCRGNDGAIERGTCSPTKLPNGSKCSTDGECKNNACGRKTYADSDNNNFICCPSGKTDTYGARDYCTEMPVNSTCASDAMCANGACGRDNNGNLICCPSGHTHTYWFKDYCGK